MDRNKNKPFLHSCSFVSNRGSLLLHLCVSVSIWGVVSGCGATHVKQAKKAGYWEQTLPMYQVVEKVNANNRKLPTLWASLKDFEVSIVDDTGKRHDEVLGGNILYRAPRELRVVGTKPLGSIVEIGSNNLLYWLTARSPGPDTVWWGRYENLGKECSKEIPVRPDLVLEVLGLSSINEDFNRLPAPTMRFNNFADAYMFVWVDKAPDRWIAWKEIWYDRKTFLPTVVALFDPNGRIVLQAKLSKHVAVEVPGLSKEQWPKVATEYDLAFPETKSKMYLKFDEVALKHKGAPNDASFQFSSDRVSVKTKIQLDEACGP
jgi:hypothetical protein